MNTNTFEIWRGKSLIDGEPIVLLASGFDSVSANDKTGDMIQTWIMHAEVEPHEAIKTGQDKSVCGDCVLRGDGSGKDRPCYVTVFRAPLALWRSWDSGNVAKMDPTKAGSVIGAGVSPPGVREGRSLRLGSYGDPAAVPYWVWHHLAEFAPARTGYTHQWRTADKRLRSLLMASVDTSTDRREAIRKGWRTFRTRSADMPLLKGEFVCPASEKGGKVTTCENCHLCDGRRRGDTRNCPVIIAHGPTKSRWAAAVGV